MTTTAPEPPLTEAEQLAIVRAELEFVQESLAELEAEDRGWKRLGELDADDFTVAQRRDITKRLRLMAVANPLIRRALNLRTFYVWGQGVDISATAQGDDGQDVNAVVQAFLDDPINRRVLTGEQARERKERQLGTDGNVFLALFTAPRTGRVQVRDIPAGEVEEIITNPDDAAEVWFYKRVWTRVDRDLTTGQPTTKSITTYYPDWRYRPRGQRVLRVGGQDVMWDAPVMHLDVNRVEGGKFGIPDAYSASFFARAYSEFLNDWARLVKALSRFAWRATAPGSKRSKVANALAAAPQVTTRGQRDGVDTAVLSDGVTLEAIPKTGATIDSESGRPLAAMVASGMDVSVVELLGDPGTVGARATAETLDRPTELMAMGRRALWSAWLQDLLGYVIDQAVRAPYGPLKGTVARDEFGREVVTLAGNTDHTIEITWPDLTEYDLEKLVRAIQAADSTGKLPPLTILRLLAQALHVPDVDDVIDKMTDDDGRFLDPQVNAGQAAADAFRRGEDPAALAGGGQADEEA